MYCRGERFRDEGMDSDRERERIRRASVFVHCGDSVAIRERGGFNESSGTSRHVDYEDVVPTCPEVRERERMRSGIVERKLLFASVGRVERAGVHGILVVREKDERRKRYVLREYLGSRENILVGNVGKPGSVAGYRSVENADGKPEYRVVDGLRRGIVHSRIGLGRKQAGIFRVGADTGKVVYRIGSRGKRDRQFGIWNPVKRSSSWRNIRSVSAS